MKRQQLPLPCKSGRGIKKQLFTKRQKNSNPRRIEVHSKEGLAWFDRLVRSGWASLPYCITIALLSVACFPFSVCVFTSICQYVQRHCTTGMYTTALLTQRSGCIKLQQLACNNIRISNWAFCLSQCQECYCCVGAGVGLCVSKSSRFIQRSR